MLKTRLAGHAWLAALTILVLVNVSTLPRAAAQTPGADQIEMFQNLSPEQQQTLLEAMGADGGSNTYRSGVRTDRPLEFPRTVRPRQPELEESDEAFAVDASGKQVPRLKGGDTVLLSLEIRQFERKAPEIEAQERRDRELTGRQPALPGRVAPTTVEAVPAIVPEQTEMQQAMLERSAEELERLKEFRERVLRRNPYKLDKWGILNVPELGPIPLGGLTEEAATQRLSAELSLADFIVSVTRLPLRPVGTEALKPFGYDLFAGTPSTFAPASDVPVPADYVVGPGDTLLVQLTGKTKGRYALVVGRDGRINFPELGPVAVAGQRFDEMRRNLEARVSEQMISTQVSVTMGDLRSIRVFVLGEAQVPGSYTVGGLSTITNALFVSGGVKNIGSLRNIQLKRDGRVVTTLDLYDLLLRGDTSGDTRLLPGDVIFIPPVGTTVGISGEVRRPAIYELKGESTAGELVELAGGLLPGADPTLATIERINERRERVIVNANLTVAQGRNSVLRSGDTVRVPPIRPVLEQAVVLNGHVHRPGEYQFTPGMRLTDLIPSVDELQPNADQRYILVRREVPPDRRIRVFSADLEQALAEPDSAANFELAARDQIFVFDRESGRDRIIQPLLRELRLQSNIDQPTLEVSIAGKVKVPGTYPLEPGMRVSDLVRAGGSLDEAAYGGQAELTRYEISNDGTRRAQLIEIDLREALNGNPSADLALRPFDYLVIKEVPLWAKQEEVEIVGEVRYPGRYPIARGETLRSVLARAGGLNDFAFAGGAVFTREELKERERRHLATLASRMESNLASASLMAAQEGGRDASQALAVGRSLLASLREAKPVGRLVIDLERAAKARPGSDQDIVLKDGDRLLVPRITQEVTVIGEVQSATSHLYRKELSRDDYIAMSGGFTPRADRKHIFVVRADGSVVTHADNAWFRGGVDIHAGDTIVVPLDTERMRPLPLWTAVTQIIYQLAVSVAAVNSF